MSSRSIDGIQYVPAWSGTFWRHDGFGFISVHVDDTRQHFPPNPTWKLLNSYYEDDAEVFVYRRFWLPSERGGEPWLKRPRSFRST